MLASAVVLGSLATSVVAVNTARALVFPDTVSLAERQSEGGRYECHANCGYALQGSSESGYCDDEEWLALFNGCLECALEYDIWRHYGGGLTPAAEACGLDATPVPVEGGDDETTTTAPPAEETTSAAEETSAAETTVADETSAAEETSPAEETSAAEETSPAEETSAVEETTVAEPTPEPTTAVETVTESWITSTPANTIPGDSTPTGSPTPIPTGAASKSWGSVFVAGAAVVLALNMI